MQGSGENKTTYETKRDDMNYKRTIPLFKLLSQKKKKKTHFNVVKQKRSTFKA